MITEGFDEVLRRAKVDHERDLRRAERREDRFERLTGAPVILCWVLLPPC